VKSTEIVVGGPDGAAEARSAAGAGAGAGRAGRHNLGATLSLATARPMSHPPRVGEILIRRAKRSEVGAVARMAAALVREHHALDSRRFMLIEPVETGYRAWLDKEVGRRGAVILVAEEDIEIVGYAYGTLEARNWSELLDACGKLNDLYVARHVRHRGIGRRLMEAMLIELKALGAPRVVLMSAEGNRGAQTFFASLGFRRTMIEMTRELDE
jgi:ribosomal protein S18 acetylase RimI-like enzyme